MVLCLCARSAFANDDGQPWTFLDRLPAAVEAGEPWVRPEVGRYVRAEMHSVREILAHAPREGDIGAPLLVTLPTPGGGWLALNVVESSVMAPALSAVWADCRTFLGSGATDRTVSARLDLTPRGFAGQVIAGGETWFIDPATRGNAEYYAVYPGRGLHPRLLGWTCQQVGGPGWRVGGFEPRDGTGRTGPTRRVLRLALATTGEYTQLQGGSAGARSAIITLVNRLNGMYEQEATLRFELVAGNDALVATDAATDAYTNNDNGTMLGENQANIDAVIGDANYDIGHVFGTANGGIAQVGIACVSGSKARGVSASPLPVTDAYTVQTFCHEIGHQIGALHTFNGVNGGCTASARSAQAAYEPGSGTTVMSYANFCGVDNVITQYGELYLTSDSLDRVLAYLSTMSCGSSSATGNTPPTLAAMAPVTIPARTPFVLSAAGSDPDGDGLTYCWEQRDLGPASPLGAGDTGAGPIIRSRTPGVSATRSFPTLADLLLGTSTPGEILPTTSRTLHFRVTARDNRAGAGGVSTDDTAVTVVGTTGPFRVTAPASNVTWIGPQTVRWDVAGTDANGIDCASVRISLSIDGGTTFPIELASGVPNTGSAGVTIPPIATSQARIRVEAFGNVFYDVSHSTFTIPCSPPTGLTASATFCDRVDLTWAPAGGANGYSVWRATTNNPLVATTIGNATAATFSDPGGVAGTLYYYWIKTLAPGCVSDFSTPAQGVRTIQTATVTGLTASNGTLCDRIAISWGAFPGAAQYRVYRSSVGTPVSSVLIATVNATSFNDTTATANQTWYYFVRAISSCGLTPFQTSPAAGLRASLPGLVGSIAATVSTLCDRVEVSGTPAPRATGYEIWRNTVDDVGTSALVAGGTALPLPDTTASPGVLYFYWVRGVNVCGVGPFAPSVPGRRARATQIGVQPHAATVCPGGTAEFSVGATGEGLLTYEWFKNDAAIPSSDSPALTLTNIGSADQGALVRCDVTGVCGTVSSVAVAITVAYCGPVVRVDASAAAGGDGSSWARAFRELRDALAYANTQAGVTEIWVAEGRYTPEATGPRTATFSPRAGLTVLGGFPAGGGDGTIGARDAHAHVSVLSGDLLGDDDTGGGVADNAYHVVTVAVDQATIVGFRIERGVADGNDTARQDRGGGVYVTPGGQANLRECSVERNRARSRGGGLCIEAGAHALVLTSLFAQNSAATGGGVSVLGETEGHGVGEFENCTFSLNSGDNVGGGLGGRGHLTLRFCTVAQNIAPEGGGVWWRDIAVDLDRSIVAHNAAGQFPDVSAPLASLGWNIIGDPAGATGLAETDQVAVDPVLSELGDHGGPTWTHALAPGSRAIDGAGTAACAPTDQRAVSRPQNGDGIGIAKCDVGAFEAETIPPICIADVDDGSGTGRPDGGVTIEDLDYFLRIFTEGSLRADVDDGSSTGEPDGGVTIEDLLYYIRRFADGC